MHATPTSELLAMDVERIARAIRRNRFERSRRIRWFDESVPPTIAELDDARAAIEAMPGWLSALRERGAVWRPIETAPHDAVVLIFLACPGIEVVDDIVIARWEDDEDFPDGGAWYPARADGGMPIDVPATHWMPIPMPPTGSGCAS